MSASPNVQIARSAVLSDEQPEPLYRFRLERRWGDGPMVLFGMLNPSTANHLVDDPTATRCEGFARDWGYAGFWIVNKYAWRSPEPKVLDCGDIDRMIGPDNDEHISAAAAEADLIVAAWGAFTMRGDEAREAKVLRLLRAHSDVHHLGLTVKGKPKHPLYLRADTKPQLWYPRLSVAS